MAKPFCSLPWSGVHINQELDVFFCCKMASPENKLGNLKSNALTDILNNNDAREVRQGFIDGIIPDKCKSACGFRSGNIINDLTAEEKQVLLTSQQLDYIGVYAADIRSSNLCTLDCVYCGPIWSSTIARRDGHYRLIPSAAQQREYQNYISSIDPTTCRRLFLAGGEPLLMKEYVPLLTQVLEHNPACLVSVNTGLSVIDTPVFDILQRLPNVTWLVSADTTDPDKFAYIRHGNTWDNFSKNLAIIKSNKGHQLAAHMVYFALSYKNFDISYSILKSMGVKDILIDPVSHPALDIRNVPHIVDQVKENIQKYRVAGIFTDEVYNSIAGKLTLPHTSPQSIQEFLSVMDAKYNMNSRTIFPELYNE